MIVNMTTKFLSLSNSLKPPMIIEMIGLLKCPDRTQNQRWPFGVDGHLAVDHVSYTTAACAARNNVTF